MFRKADRQDLQNIPAAISALRIQLDSRDRVLAAWLQEIATRLEELEQEDLKRNLQDLRGMVEKISTLQAKDYTAIMERFADFGGRMLDICASVEDLRAQNKTIFENIHDQLKFYAGFPEAYKQFVEGQNSLRARLDDAERNLYGQTATVGQHAADLFYKLADIDSRTVNQWDAIGHFKENLVKLNRRMGKLEENLTLWIGFGPTDAIAEDVKSGKAVTKKQRRGQARSSK